MKIFVQIAAYRDPELGNTIESLLQNAKYPENISIGICHQKGDDEWDNIDKYTGISSIRVITTPYQESKGACWARSITQSLFDNEDFTLQIDSHSRLEPEWDNKLLNLYDSLNDDMAVISAYPSMFTPGQTYEQFNKRIYMCHVYKMQNGFISARPKLLPTTSSPPKASAIAAGFIFSKSTIINDIKYDPEFYFTGEEAALAVRFFTSGYNLYHPNINILYHYYTRAEQKKHWSDHTNHHEYTHKSYQRLRCLIGQSKSCDLGQYGLGSKRSLNEWTAYSGIDYINRKLHSDLIDGKLPPFINHPKLWVPQHQTIPLPKKL